MGSVSRWMTWGESPRLSQSASEQKEEVCAPDEEPLGVSWASAALLTLPRLPVTLSRKH